MQLEQSCGKIFNLGKKTEKIEVCFKIYVEIGDILMSTKELINWKMTACLLFNEEFLGGNEPGYTWKFIFFY